MKHRISAAGHTAVIDVGDDRQALGRHDVVLRCACWCLVDAVAAGELEVRFEERWTVVLLVNFDILEGFKMAKTACGGLQCSRLAVGGGERETRAVN